MQPLILSLGAILGAIDHDVLDVQSFEWNKLNIFKNEKVDTKEETKEKKKKEKPEKVWIPEWEEGFSKEMWKPGEKEEAEAMLKAEMDAYDAEEKDEVESEPTDIKYAKERYKKYYEEKLEEEKEELLNKKMKLSKKRTKLAK